MKRFYLLPSLLLAACCPTVLPDVATAFRAEVVGITPAASELQLQREVGTPHLTLNVAQAKLETANGYPLTLKAFRPGDSVYVSGTMRAAEIIANEVRRLE